MRKAAFLAFLLLLLPWDPCAGASPVFFLGLGVGEGGAKIDAKASAALPGSWSLEAGLGFGEAAEDRPSLSWSWKGARGYAGQGGLGRGASYRPRAYSKAPGEEAALWTSSGSAQVLGWGSGPLAAVWEAEPDGAGRGQAGFGRLKAAGIQISSLPSGGLGLSSSLGLASLREAEPGSGWRPGSAGLPARLVFDLGLFSWYRWNGGRLGLWASGSWGSLAAPGLAASAQGEAGWTLPAERGGEAVEVRLAGFAYAAGETYLEAEGGVPALDLVLEGEAAVSAPSWAAKAALKACSRGKGSDNTFDHRLLRAGIPLADRLLWLWRIDRLEAGLSGRLGSISLALAAKADALGPASAQAVLKAAFGLLPRLDVELSLEARGARTGDEEEEGEEPDEAAETGKGEFSARRLGLRFTLRWRGSRVPSGIFAAGPLSAKFLLIVKADEGWSPFLDFGLSAGFRAWDRIALVLGAEAPEGGYSLTKPPNLLPDLSLGLRLELSRP